MKSPIRPTFAAALSFTLMSIVTTSPASAITAELATKCREMSLKAFPPARIGTKNGNAGEARKYYNICVANKGSPPDDSDKKATPSR